ncbi:MAG: class I SAM-dependent methyltransferase [Magnetococcales bacterium]|nr:class I SAM-dependent methyltransferase [Magnetococcales bacterium]
MVAVLVDSADLLSQGRVWADRLALPLTQRADPGVATLFLTLTADRLELRSADPAEGGAVYVDFVAGKGGFRRQREGGLRQPLARAVGLRGSRPCTIVDATPGLGQDALVLAALGGEVQMVERSPVVAALLADGLRRLAAQRLEQPLLLTLQEGDARLVLAGLEVEGVRPDVVYLDPMYPHREGSALSKKEMRRLRILVGDDDDAAALLAVAVRVARQRVVVKRPRQAPVLGDRRPTMAIYSKNTRYDVYLTADRQRV